MSTKPINWLAVAEHRANFGHPAPLMCMAPDCRVEYIPTPAGRLDHRRFYGHAPCTGNAPRRRDEVHIPCDTGGKEETAPDGVGAPLFRGLTPSKEGL